MEEADRGCKEERRRGCRRRLGSRCSSTTRLRSGRPLCRAPCLTPSAMWRRPWACASRRSTGVCATRSPSASAPRSAQSSALQETPPPRRRPRRGAAASASTQPRAPPGLAVLLPSQPRSSAYRRLALKYHPDVNKEANDQEKFLRIKHTYNTLNSESRSKYASSSSSPDSSWAPGSSKSADAEEEFYGFGVPRAVEASVGVRVAYWHVSG